MIVAATTITTSIAFALTLLTGLAVISTLGGCRIGRRTTFGFGTSLCRRVNLILGRSLLTRGFRIGCLGIFGFCGFSRLIRIFGLLDLGLGLSGLLGILGLFGCPTLTHGLLLGCSLGGLICNRKLGHVDERELLLGNGSCRGFLGFLRRGLTRCRLARRGLLGSRRRLLGCSRRLLGCSALRRRCLGRRLGSGLARGLLCRRLLLGCLGEDYGLFTHAFLTFSQSALNFSRPCSVSG